MNILAIKVKINGTQCWVISKSCDVTAPDVFVGTNYIFPCNEPEENYHPTRIHAP